MTYRELLEELKKLQDEQLDLDVTVRCVVDEEFFSADLCYADEDCDVLDGGHPYLSSIQP